MKKTWILLAICTMSIPLFTACTSNADTMPQNSPTVSVGPTAAPTTAPTTDMNPMDNLLPSATDNAAGMTGSAGSTTGSMTGTTDTMNNGGVNTVEDALRVSGQIADEVEKLSEVDDAKAVVAGNIAIVGIDYADQYQSGLTDRLKDMITERVETIDKAVTSVHVTDSMETVSMIEELYRKLEKAGISFDELQTQLLNLGSTITGGETPKVNQPQSNTAGRA